MSYLDELLAYSQNTLAQQTQNTQRLMGDSGLAYSSFYPSWEVQTPQFVMPSPYTLANIGYRINELAFTCINERATRAAEAFLMQYEVDEEGTLEEVPKSNLRKLMKNPCVRMSEKDFIKITMIYTLIAGFCVWEKERNNLGEVVRLWPMRPDWCSFLRGQQQPLRAIRYQPYGLPFADVPIEDCVVFQYFDPIFPQLKGLSPTAVALEIINSDNNMTQLVNSFIMNGAFLGGVLKTEQVLQDAEAQRIRDRWREQHAGSKNAGDIAVFGKGVEFSNTSQTFRDMVFPEVDARAEARICMIYRISPITIAAKIGIGAATYNNYKEARSANYESVTMDDWGYIASTIENQLLPDFVDNVDDYTVQFDTSRVKALQEDQTAKVARAVSMYEKRIAKLNEARKEMGLDPIEGKEGDSFYEAVRLSSNQTMDAEGNLMNSVQPPAPPALAPFVDKVQSAADQEAADEEVKKFKEFAKTRIKENKHTDITEYKFKFVAPKQQYELIHQYTTLALASAINKAAG